jgi:threonine dehydratase
MAVLRERLDDFRLVRETDIERGVYDLYTRETIPMEGACATSLAAMRELGDELAGQTIVFPVSGRNIDSKTLDRILNTYNHETS